MWFFLLVGGLIVLAILMPLARAIAEWSGRQ
jgi:hypothetical protein